MHSNATQSKKWVLVTGGTRGIGRGLVEAFCGAGYDVAFTYQRSHEAADALQQAMAAGGASAVGHCCDSADEAAVNALAQALLAERGAPHAIINNVGITRDGVLMRMSSTQWTDVINANLNAAFYVTRPFVQAMLGNGDGVPLLPFFAFAGPSKEPTGQQANLRARVRRSAFPTKYQSFA